MDPALPRLPLDPADPSDFTESAVDAIFDLPLPPLPLPLPSMAATLECVSDPLTAVAGVPFAFDIAGVGVAAFAFAETNGRAGVGCKAAGGINAGCKAAGCKAAARTAAEAAS